MRKHPSGSVATAHYCFFLSYSVFRRTFWTRDSVISTCAPNMQIFVRNGGSVVTRGRDNGGGENISTQKLGNCCNGGTQLEPCWGEEEGSGNCFPHNMHRGRAMPTRSQVVCSAATDIRCTEGGVISFTVGSSRNFFFFFFFIRTHHLTNQIFFFCSQPSFLRAPLLPSHFFQRAVAARPTCPSRAVESSSTAL